MKIALAGFVAQVSGSQGGSTYSKNRYGYYVRNKTKPVNPNTPAQSSIRSKFAQLMSSWGLLTTAQREAWSNYALNTPIIDKLGKGIILPGQQMYVGNNVLRLQAGLSIVSDGPVTFGLPELTLPVATITAGDPMSIAITNTDSWAGEVGGALLVFASRPKAPTVNFFKGPWLYAGKIAGAATPPVSPQTVAAPFAYSADQQIFLRYVAVTADGRVSADNYGSCFCGA